MENEKGKVLLSAKELKEILGCNNNTLYELLARPDFPSFRIKSRHYVLYEDFLAWAREQAKQKAIGDSGPRFSVSKKAKKL